MANLRRTKLKARRVGCNLKEVEACTEVSQVLKLMLDRDNTPKDVEKNLDLNKDGGSESATGE